MANMNISGVSASVEAANQLAKHPQGESATRSQQLSIADSVKLSSEARRHMEELAEAKTVAEAFLKHLLENVITEASASDSEQDMTEKDAQKQFKGAFDRMMMDLSWLIDALGVPPEESSKLSSVLAARASVDYVTARPPVVEIIARAPGDNVVPTLFVQNLVIDISPNGIDGASVERVAVTQSNPSFAAQLTDPNAQRVVVMADQSTPDARGAKKAFDDNLNARLQQTPHPDIQGMLIVRENAAAGDSRRLRVDALTIL